MFLVKLNRGSLKTRVLGSQMVVKSKGNGSPATSGKSRPETLEPWPETLDLPPPRPQDAKDLLHHQVDMNRTFRCSGIPTAQPLSCDCYWVGG